MATNTNIGTSGPGLLSLPNMASVVSTPGGVVSSLGRGMAADSVFPRLPNLEFYARGRGRNLLHGHVGGFQGTLEVHATLGATGTARALCFLTDVEGSANVIILSVTTTNAPNVTIRDHAGVIVAATNNAAALASGARIRLRVAWDSRNPVSGLNYAVVSLNGVELTYSTAPTAAWTAFQPTLLMLAGAQGAFSDANGIIEVVQASNTVSP